MIRHSPEQVLRCSLVVEPLQPFIDWHDALEPDGEGYVEISQDEGETVFLIPPFDDPEESRAYIDEHFDVFFTHVLEMHCTDPKRWPQRRTVGQFRSWFRARIHSLVLDVDPDPLTHG